MFDWGDLRFLLATARSGSTSAAAVTLGVNQTTVARRIAALEHSLGVPLFERRQDGYRLTEGGLALLDQAQRVEVEADTLAKMAAQRLRSLSGVIRVTTTEPLANFVLTPWLSEFMELYPDIQVELIATDQRLDLSRGAADVSLRASRRPNDASVVYRKLARGTWALYCSTDYARRRGAPETAGQLEEHALIGADGSLAQLDPFVWLQTAAPRARRRSVCTNVMNVIAAARAGHGIAPLPCSVGDFDPGLVRCMQLPPFDYTYFLVTAARVKDLPRIKAFTAFIVRQCTEKRELLEGRS